MFNSPFKKPIPQRTPKENCKIKIKNTKGGKTISFEGNCTKENIEMAKSMYGTDKVEEEE